MEKLKNIFRGKDKTAITNIVACLAAGVILLILGNSFFSENNRNTDTVNSEEMQPVVNSTGNVNSSLSYEAELEQRLEKILSEAAGAGQVKTMIKLSYGKEIVIAEDTVSDISETKEIDAAGGSREVSSQSIENKKIIVPGTNGSKPLVLKEIEPKIEGVIIIAEGGGDIFVKDALIKATQTVLGVEPHKVQVLKMKEKN